MSHLSTLASPQVTTATHVKSVVSLAQPKLIAPLFFMKKGLFGTYSEVSRSSSTYYGHTHEFSGTANIKSGTTYKLVTTATVTRNGSSETVSNTFEKKC